jgi:hypothetical protein
MVELQEDEASSSKARDRGALYGGFWWFLFRLNT